MLLLLNYKYNTLKQDEFWKREKDDVHKPFAQRISHVSVKY